MGLPQNTLSITVDGASVQDKYTRSGDGFFANLQPRLDMVEEVTVSSATAGAESSGQGAVQIKFVTRSGTNSSSARLRLHAAPQPEHEQLLQYPQQPAEERPRAQSISGARRWPDRRSRVLDGRGKAFFFANMEQLRFPLSNTRTRGILTPAAQQGIFRYAASGGTREVNLPRWRRGNGQTTTVDPTVGALLARFAPALRRPVSSTIGPTSTCRLPVQPESLRIDTSQRCGSTSISARGTA